MSKSKTKTLKGLKRGYVATLKTKVFNFGTGRHKYEVYELSGPKMDKPRYFVDELSVQMFVNANETEAVLTKQFNNAVKRATSKSERKELQAAKELSELMDVDIAKHIDADMRDTKARRPEDTDK
jgi:phosphate starvation-inducible protein PhoH